jgi:hypothetical protein
MPAAGPAAGINAGWERPARGGEAPFSDILEFSAQNEKIGIARARGRSYNFFIHGDFPSSR